MSRSDVRIRTGAVRGIYRIGRNASVEQPTIGLHILGCGLTRKPPLAFGHTGVFVWVDLVAGTGFEPVTFRL